MMAKRALVAFLLLVSFALVVCSHKEESAIEDNEIKGGLLVTAAPALRGALQSTLIIPGITVALKQVIVRAPSSGVLSNLALQPGDRVRRGQTVAKVITREDIAARTGARLAQQLDPADSEAMAAAVERYASSPGITVTAGDGGTVAKRDTSNGQFVNEFDPIVELLDPNSIYVEAQAPLRFLTRIHPGQTASITSPALAQPIRAQIAAILPNAAQTSQTFPIRITFEQPRVILTAGVAVEALLTMTSHPNALMIPAGAVFVNPENQTHYVFTVGADRKAHRQTIEVGIQQPSEVEILDGLRAGTMVITSGGYALSDGLRVRIAARR
jgi:RND family efflux transporter MFP subunit